MDRELDGVFIRWQDPNGRWHNKCTTDLPWENVEAWLVRCPLEFVMNYAKILHQVILELGVQFDLARTEPPPPPPGGQTADKR